MMDWILNHWNVSKRDQKNLWWTESSTTEMSQNETKRIHDGLNPQPLKCLKTRPKEFMMDWILNHWNVSKRDQKFSFRSIRLEKEDFVVIRPTYLTTCNYYACRFREIRRLSTGVSDNPSKIDHTKASAIDKGPCTYSSDLVETLSLSLWACPEEQLLPMLTDSLLYLLNTSSTDCVYSLLDVCCLHFLYGMS